MYISMHEADLQFHTHMHPATDNPTLTTTTTHHTFINQLRGSMQPSNIILILILILASKPFSLQYH